MSEAITTVLVVEDDHLARMALEDIFEALGCRCLLARDGQEALELYDQSGPTIDLVLSDLKMPRIDGLELYQRLKAINPDVKVVLATGAAPEEEGRDPRAQGIVGWMQKPYSIDRLAQALTQATGGS